MKSTLNKYNLAFGGMQCFLWAGFSVSYGFFVPYLKSCGFSEVNIGIIMSILSFVGIVGPILWGAVSDRTNRPKVILIVNILAGAVLDQLVPAVVGNWWLLLAVLVAVNLTLFAQPSVLDGWAMHLRSRGAPINYGLTRGVGSLAYAITSVAVGLALSRLGLGAMFPVILGLGVITALCVLLMREDPSLHEEAAIAAEPDGAGTPIHRNPAFLLFIGLSTVLFVGVSATLTFYPLLLQSAGGGTADIGLALGLCAFSEFPVMMLSNWLLRRWKDTTLLLFAMGFYVVRILLFYTLTGVTGLVLSQLTNSLSYGIFLPTAVHFVSRIAPARTRTTAISLAFSMYMGLGGILGSLLGGILIDAVGIRAMFGLAAAVAVAVTAAFGIALAATRKKGIFGDGAQKA